jgi:hypothetical protein
MQPNAGTVSPLVFFHRNTPVLSAVTRLLPKCLLASVIDSAPSTREHGISASFEHATQASSNRLTFVSRHDLPIELHVA